jgi:hypothetical protein
MEQEQMSQQVPGSLWEALGAKKKEEDGKGTKVEIQEGMGGSS